jgi:lipoprotein LprA
VQGAVTNLAVTKLDGDVSSTPQTVATGTATLTVGKKNVDSKFVFVDGHLYSDVADPGKYADYGNGSSIYDVSTLLDPNKGLANLLSNLKNPAVAGSEQVNGIATTKITGTSSPDDIATLAGARLSTQDAQTTPTTVWIASDGSYHLVRIEITPVENGTVTMTLSDWGKQVTATKPV